MIDLSSISCWATPPLSIFRSLAIIAVAAGALTLGGCTAPLYAPALATREYPELLLQSEVIQMQAVPRETVLQIINGTATDYREVDIWVNRRYMKHVSAILAGETIEVLITDFRDVWGQCPQPGGFWRTRAPTPLVLVQIQRDETNPLLGMVAVVPADAGY
ncbi:MAG: hypothetical protein O3B75_08675 [Planctomycetota bacterium]|nr:hypothetical protein [Planctomycetota bacterium]